MNYPHQPGSPNFEGGAAYEAFQDQAERDRLIEAAPDLLAAAKLQEAAEAFHLACVECEGNEIPELCEACFPHYDDARIARRNAIAKAVGPSLAQDE